MSRSAANADIFQAIADPTRRALLDQLGREQPQQLAQPLTCFTCHLSHLQVLCDVELVNHQRGDGNGSIFIQILTM